jgi:hypothetical protein
LTGKPTKLHQLRDVAEDELVAKLGVGVANSK